MNTTDFDAYVAVDFSANKRPKAGKDSIWWSCASWSDGDLVVSEARNPRTRDAGSVEIRALLAERMARTESVLIGFDFPYGYPAGFAAALGLASPGWRSTWEYLRTKIQDRQDQRWNNRFEIAAEINTRLGPNGRFWGCPTSIQIAGLTGTKPASAGRLREFRHAEIAAARGSKATWQLFYHGSVGSQVLLGLPRLAALRSAPELAPVSLVWPFETGATLPARRPGQARIVHAEIYPSLIPVHPEAHKV